ncbi:MAG: hypothetical protein WDA17_00150 [Sphaerochaetaceae bacterium]|jgi:hypothetical protein
MRRCYFCKTEVDPLLTIGYQSNCSNCGRSLKICLNCKFYSPSAYHECLEGVEERVANKDLPNYCEFFVMKNYGTKDEQDNEANKARSAFLALFNDE